jgi:hypothetical protein
MKKPKHESKASAAARFQKQAQKMLADHHNGQSRFLDNAIVSAGAIEPPGRIAG